MKIESTVYKTQSFLLKGEEVKFIGGKAEVSDAIWAEIKKLGLPGIFPDGEAPSPETEKEAAMTDDFKQYKAEMEAEVARLKNIIESKDIELGKAQKEAATWRETCAKIQKTKEAAPVNIKVKAESPASEASPAADTSMKTELEAMKVDELKELAATENIPAKDLKDKKKDEIIDILLSKLENK